MGNNSLKIGAKAYPESISVVWFYRMVYLPTDAGNVELSLYVNSLTGFRDYDGFTLIICNENFTQQLFISSWNRADALRLFNAPGFYEIKLSSLWFTEFNTSSPSRFFLQLEVYDSSATEDVFFFDSLNVTFHAQNIQK
jgi:hypothetical protein